MICRLCLFSLHNDNAIELFEESESNKEKSLTQLIEKHLHLQFTEGDSVSTSICTGCFNHLNEFHKFWTYVDERQTILNKVLLKAEYAEIETEEEFHDNMNSKMQEIGQCINEVLPDINDILDEFAENNENRDEYCKEKESSMDLNQLEETELDTLKKDEEFVAKFFSYTCELCKLPLETYNILCEHYSSIHKIPPYILCCKTKFEKLSVFANHIQWHLDSHCNICEICHREFRSLTSLQKHKLAKHPLCFYQEYFKCSVCNKSFEKPQHLRCHIEIIHGHSIEPLQKRKSTNLLSTVNEGSFKCSLCDMSFQEAKYLRYHIEVMHGSSINNMYVHDNELKCGELNTNSNKNIFPCPHCKEQFISKAFVSRHIRQIHSKKKSALKL